MNKFTPKARNDLAKNKDLKQTVEDTLTKKRKIKTKAIKEIIRLKKKYRGKKKKIEFWTLPWAIKQNHSNYS